MKKFLVVFVIAIMVLSLIAMPKVVKADSEPLEPDFITDKIIFIGPASSYEVMSELKEGTLGIVSLVDGYYLGFNIPGGNLCTDIIITVPPSTITGIVPTTPVGLKLNQGKLFVYFSRIEIVSLPWNDASVPELKNSWFPQYLALQIVKIEATGAYEKHVSYCCNPPLVQISYFYELYLTSESDPNSPPKSYNYTLGVMIPDYLEELVQEMAKNHDFIFLEANNKRETNRIFIWLPH